jgi:peroxiredoxin Q/BCP
MAMVSTAAGLRVGDAAPDFSALDEAGREHRLRDYKGKTVVLYFYPRDSTPGCTTEACDFRDNHKAFLKKGSVVLGVSPDSAKSHLGFKTRQGLPFPLLIDEAKSLCRAYGVWKEKSMYGRKFMGVERSTFVIGPDGRLKDIMRKISVPGHVEAVLGAL